MTTANGDAAATAADEVQSIVEALFRGPRERFVTERNAAAKRLKGLGRSEDATRVKALSKPSVSAAAVNRLWWERRAEFEALLDGGRQMAAAMSTGAGPAQQAAAALGKRRALERLIALAEDDLRAAGSSASMAVMRKISTTLEALAVHILHEGGPRPGCLSADLEPPGFDLLPTLAAGASMIAPPPPKPTGPALVEPDAQAEAEARIATAERAEAKAREHAQAAARTLDHRTAEASEAQLASRRAAQIFEDAKASLAEAQRACEAAERGAHRTRTEAERRQTQVEDARRALQGLGEALQQREDALREARAHLASLPQK
ncbi:MAG: hypothetical protein AAF799_01710 [Myxococcota bacterium]